MTTYDANDLSTKSQYERYKARYDRCIAQSKDKSRNEALRAADKAEADRIKRAYL